VDHSWAKAGELALTELRLAASTKETIVPQMRRLARLSRLRRLDLRRARLDAFCLERLLSAAPSLTDVDATFAEPLPWSTYGPLLARFSQVRFDDTLTQGPSADLSPSDVIHAQCYALHANRLDLSARFASSLWSSDGLALKLSSSRYSERMLDCDMWRVESLHVKTDVAFGLVHFRKCSNNAVFHWKLSLQENGMWATDMISEASWHDLMMMDIDE